MKNSTGALASGQAMQKCFGTAFGLSLNHGMSVFVDQNEIVRPQIAFIFTAGSYQDTKRVSLDDHTVVARGSTRPTARPELVSDAAQSVDRFGVRSEMVHVEIQR
jgi:hypothetical protein